MGSVVLTLYFGGGGGLIMVGVIATQCLHALVLVLRLQPEYAVLFHKGNRISLRPHKLLESAGTDPTRVVPGTAPPTQRPAREGIVVLQTTIGTTSET